MTNFVTPKGIAVWPKLNQPDYKFNVDGEYSVKLKLSAEESQGLIKQLEDERDAYKAEVTKKNPKVSNYNLASVYEEEMDDQGNLTGFNLFKFKQKAVIKTKSGDSIKKTVALYDSNKTPTDVVVNGGSTIKVAASTFCYNMPSSKMVGISLRPTAVQIIELSQGAGGVEALAMFDKEDGFVGNGVYNGGISATAFDSSEAVAVSDDADF